MVKFRGIEISIISQFDICKLPEFRFHPLSQDPFHENETTSNDRATASCYVPIYPGCQVWFEYSIDGPHPPSAAYLFKLFINGKPVTNWDCTAKHDYHGKMMYNLCSEGMDPETGKAQMVRQAMHFAPEIEAEPQLYEDKDVIELRLHRIEYRKRLRNMEAGLDQREVGNKSDDGLQLSNGGLLEPGFPRRRYKYQLLDPVDEPYAAFRFQYRSYEFLEKHGIITSVTSTDASSVQSREWHDSSSNAPYDKTEATPEVLPEPQTPMSSSSRYTVQTHSPEDDHLLGEQSEQSPRAEKRKSAGSRSYLLPSDSDESLNVVTKDSIEDLSSVVPRSPKSVKDKETDKGTHAMPPSPELSPRRSLKKKLTVTVGGTEFDIDMKRRPMSPFTSGGMLRRFVPPSAPAAVTEFGPSIEDEIDPGRRESKQTDRSPERSVKRTTRAERGGTKLMGFLGRRFGSN